MAKKKKKTTSSINKLLATQTPIVTSDNVAKPNQLIASFSTLSFLNTDTFQTVTTSSNLYDFYIEEIVILTYCANLSIYHDLSIFDGDTNGKLLLSVNLKNNIVNNLVIPLKTPIKQETNSISIKTNEVTVLNDCFSVTLIGYEVLK
jgi:hypothetical protein